MTAPTPAAPIFPPDSVHKIRALVRVGCHLPRGLQGRVFWWRLQAQRVAKPSQAMYLAGDYYKTFPGKYLGEDDEHKPWPWAAYPTDIIIDPTEEQIAEEMRKLEALS